MPSTGISHPNSSKIYFYITRPVLGEGGGVPKGQFNLPKEMHPEAKKMVLKPENENKKD